MISVPWKKFYAFGLFDYLLIAFGVFLRVKHFAENQSLWVDEAYVANEIVIKSFQEMFSFYTVFSSQPQTPILFQAITKGVVTLWGTHEMALRLLPLLCSIAALFLFYRLLKTLVSPVTATVAMGLFVFNNHLIYYAAEVKPYACDVLAALIIVSLFLKIQERGFLSGLFSFSVVAVILSWLSFPAIFVSAGVLITAMGHAFLNRDGNVLRKILVTFLIIVFSFGIVYFLSLATMMKSDYIKGTWAGSFLPWDKGVYGALQWMAGVFIHIFKNPVDTVFPLFSLLVFFIGCFSFWKNFGFNRFLMLISPLILVFGAALFQMYPFKERMLLFLTPLLTVLLAQGIVYISRQWKKLSVAVGCLCLIMTVPIQQSVSHIQQERLKVKNREVLAFLKEHYRPGDQIFYNNAAQYAFQYYLMQFEFSKNLKSEMGDPLLLKGEYLIKTVKLIDQILIYDNKKYMGYMNGYMIFKGNQSMGRLILKDGSYDMIKTHGSWGLKTGERAWLFLSETKEEPREFILQRFRSAGNEVLSMEKYKAGVYLFTLK